MMTPIPHMNPVTMGTDMKSANQPSLSSPTAKTRTPVTSAVAATSE